MIFVFVTSMKTFPGYFKYFIVLSSIMLTCYLLILGKFILSPVLAAFVIALLLHPICAYLERRKIPRVLSSILSILVIFVLLGGISYFFSAQVNSISNDLNAIGARFNELIDRGYVWMKDTFGIEQQAQTLYLKAALNRLLQNSNSAFTQTVSATADFVTSFFLFLITLFFFLYYRRFFVTFLYYWFRPEDHSAVGSTLRKIEQVVRSYILGMLIVITIVATLNTLGLMILGIQHAIFFGVLAAVLIIIPYVGIFIGSLLPILFAMVTESSLWYPVGVAMVLWGVQFLEGNFITPNIVGGKVSINPFAVIIALFFSGMLWGIPGMILSIPVLAIIKVICDAVPSWKPIGFLLGTAPEDHADLEKRRTQLYRVLKRQRRRDKVEA